ncbi:hypothetical protein SK128_007066 [Halocaridina rubra]|uniref:GATA-type domain-containing protein n=1 Tax=Halocaridina rubra TaxID=373956 RepID=A0AAN8WZA0_HALRR
MAHRSSKTQFNSGLDLGTLDVAAFETARKSNFYLKSADMEDVYHNTSVMEQSAQLSSASNLSCDSKSADSDIVCIEVESEDDIEANTCNIEVIHKEEECLNKYILPFSTYLPRKFYLKPNIHIPKVLDSMHYAIFEISDSCILDNPLISNYRPPAYKLRCYINKLKEKNSGSRCYGVYLDYGRFDSEGLLVFQELQICEETADERLWFAKHNYDKPTGSCRMDMAAIKEFQIWLLNFRSNDVVPIRGRISLRTNEIADVACERWIKDPIINYFSSLIQDNFSQTYVVNFIEYNDIMHDIEAIRNLRRIAKEGTQILFLSSLGIHPGSDETFLTQDSFHTSHYAFASFFFSDKKIIYADTLGLRMPSEFIGKVNFIFAHFDVEPTFQYCHDPNGTLIENEPRFINHTCTQNCAMHYPLQTCTNMSGIAVIIGMCIAAGSRTNFIEMSTPQKSVCQFAYLESISHYSHYLRLALMHYMVKSHIDLGLLTNSEQDSVSYEYKGCIERNNIRRGKNVLDITYVSDLIHDAALKYAKSRGKQVMLLICRLRPSGKLVTKSFPCSSQGQYANNCVMDIQRFLHSQNCRVWLNCIDKSNSQFEQAERNSFMECSDIVGCSKVINISESGVCPQNVESRYNTKIHVEICHDEPPKHNRRKNHLDISKVSDLICDARLKFVRIKSKPCLQLGCIIKSLAKSVTKAFPCSSLGQDDLECVSRIQRFINSPECVEWLNGYMKAVKTFRGNITSGMKLGYRRNYMDIQRVSHLISDARVRFITCKGKPCMQLLCQLKANKKTVTKLFSESLQRQHEKQSVALVQKYLNSNACLSWLLNCSDRDILNIKKLSHLILDAKLKFTRIRRRSVVQLLCQLKSTNRYVRRTFSLGTLSHDEKVAYVQDYINSSSCAKWLQRCRITQSLNNMPLDISNICHLVDEAKLKFQIINNKPVLQLQCYLISSKKCVSKNFPCSSADSDYSECRTRIQKFLNNIDCHSWLYRIIIKNLIYTKSNDQEYLGISKLESVYSTNVSAIETTNAVIHGIKMDPDYDSWMDSKAKSQSPSMNIVSTGDDSRKKESCNVESEYGSQNILQGNFLTENFLNLKNISDYVEDVKLKFIRVNNDLFLCLMCLVRGIGVTVKKLFSFGNENNISKLLTRVQSFINGKKCFRWICKSISYMDGKAILKVENIADLIEYSKLKYVYVKGKPLMYFVCKLKSNKKVVRKPFVCPALGREYVKCIGEIQAFVSSSNCRTWLSIHSGNSQHMNSRSNCKNYLLKAGVHNIIQSPKFVATSASKRKLNIQNISALVTGINTKIISHGDKRILKLCFLLKTSGRIVKKCITCTSKGMSDAKTYLLVQKFITSKNCKKWLQMYAERHKQLKLLGSERALGTTISDTREFSCAESKHLEKSPLNLQNAPNTAALFQNKNILDVRNIQHLIYYAKLMFVKSKGKFLLQLLCHIRGNGSIITKNFPCSSLGLNDKNALNEIQKFVNSITCQRWLSSACEVQQSSQCNISRNSKSKLFNNISRSQPMIVGKPEIVFLKPKTLRLVCRLRNGRTKCKSFSCSIEGKNDLKAMQAVNKFLDSESFNDWIEKAENKNKREEEWKFYTSVKTGSDTQSFVNNLPFDVTQRFCLNKKQKYEVVIHRNLGISKKRIVENPAWGTTHRLDDTYSIKDSLPKKSTVAVCVVLSCASKTDECRTQCGKLVKNVSVIDNNFTCCGLEVKNNRCSNCCTYMTPQWCRKENDALLCKNCDMYLRAHGVNRPSHFWKESLTTNFKHLKCKWKMKLVLMSDDMSRWHVYKCSDNDDRHDLIIQNRKRLSQCSKDQWCSAEDRKLNWNQETSPCKKKKISGNLKSKCLSGEQKEAQLQGVNSMRISKGESEIIVKQEDQLNCPEENIQYIEINENSELDGSILPEETSSPVQDLDCQEYSDTALPQSELNTSANVTKIENDNASMVCLKCIQENVQNIFGCSSKKQMDLHILQCHKEELFACAACYIKDNIVMTFMSESLFKEHLKDHE